MLPLTVDFFKKFHRRAQLYSGYSSRLLVNTARTARTMHFWAALWNMPAPSFKESITHLIWSDPCPICTALSLFFFSSSQGLMKVCEYFDPISPPRLVSGPGGGTVVNASWLTDSHVSDSGSDWLSPCSSHMASEYSSLRPFLVLSPTVPFCCTKYWEWVPSFVSCF